MIRRAVLILLSICLPTYTPILKRTLIQGEDFTNANKEEELQT